MSEPIEVVRELYAAVAAGDRVLVGLRADTMEGRPARWWSVLTVCDDRVTTIADYSRQRDARRALPPKNEALPQRR